MRQITLNDPNFDIKKSLDTLIVMNKLNDGSSGKLSNDLGIYLKIKKFPCGAKHDE